MKKGLVSLAVAVWVGALHANTVAFNTFGPGDTYTGSQGFNVASADSQIGYESTGAKFTSAATGQILQVDLGITNANNGSGLFDLFLYGSVPGMPKNDSQVLLGSGAATAAFGANNSVITVNPVTPVSIVTGGIYWLVVKPGGAGVLDAWNVSSPAIAGEVSNSLDDATWIPNFPILP